MNGQQPIVMNDKLSKPGPIPKLPPMANSGNPDGLLHHRRIWRKQRDSM